MLRAPARSPTGASPVRVRSPGNHRAGTQPWRALPSVKETRQVRGLGTGDIVAPWRRKGEYDEPVQISSAVWYRNSSLRSSTSSGRVAGSAGLLYEKVCDR